MWSDEFEKSAPMMQEMRRGIAPAEAEVIRGIFVLMDKNESSPKHGIEYKSITLRHQKMANLG